MRHPDTSDFSPVTPPSNNPGFGVYERNAESMYAENMFRWCESRRGVWSDHAE